MADLMEQDLFERTRTREQLPLPARERCIEAGLSVFVLVAVAITWLALPHGPAYRPGVAELLVVAFAA